MFQGFGHVAGLVALQAFQLLMNAQEGEIRLIVVERIARPDHFERTFLVAFLTILTEFVFMHVLVTSVAVGIAQVSEALPHVAVHHFLLVAFLASQGFMLAQEGKMRFIVVEGLGIFKTVETVAIRAIGRHFALVVVVVAGQTGLVQSQIRRFLLFKVWIRDVLRIMAFGTIQRGMHALFDEAGLVVVEGFLVQVNQSESATMVFVVAGIAIFAQHVGGTVIPFLCRLIAAYNRVTSQTIGVGHLVAHRMAFGTVADTFQVGVRIAQIAG